MRHKSGKPDLCDKPGHDAVLLTQDVALVIRMDDAEFASCLSADMPGFLPGIHVLTTSTHSVPRVLRMDDKRASSSDWRQRHCRNFASPARRISIFRFCPSGRRARPSLRAQRCL